MLARPFRLGKMQLAQQYRDILLNAGGLTTIALSQEIAERAAELRADHNLRTPDAIQVATVKRAGSSSLLTNDARLASLPSPKVLVLDRLKAGLR